MRGIDELSGIAFYEMGSIHQITIDYVQEVEELLINGLPESESEKSEQLIYLGAASYNISISLEVFNPELKKEIDILKGLLTLIEIRMGKLEAIDFKTTSSP